MNIGSVLHIRALMIVTQLRRVMWPLYDRSIFNFPTSPTVPSSNFECCHGHLPRQPHTSIFMFLRYIYVRCQLLSSILHPVGQSLILLICIYPTPLLGTRLHHRHAVTGKWWIHRCTFDMITNYTVRLAYINITHFFFFFPATFHAVHMTIQRCFPNGAWNQFWSIVPEGSITKLRPALICLQVASEMYRSRDINLHVWCIALVFKQFAESKKEYTKGKWKGKSGKKIILVGPSVFIPYRE